MAYLTTTAGAALTLLADTENETGSTCEAAIAQLGGTNNDPSGVALPRPADGTPDKDCNGPSAWGFE